MSIFDYEEAPPPPPRYQTKVQKAKVVKDKSLKDEILYEVQSYDDYIGDWYQLESGIDSEKEARCFVRDCKDFDKENGIKLKYRIVKLTIKKEVVK